MRKDWIKCVLGDILYLKNGYAFKSSKYSLSGIPIIRISDINDRIVDSSKSKLIEMSEDYENYTVKKNDILIAMSGATTGKYGIFKENIKAYQNQRVGNFQLFSENYFNKKFLYHLIGSIKGEIEKKAYGGAQPNISPTKIESINISFPPLPEQKAIVAKIEQLFSALDNGIANLKKTQAQLKIYRQAVLKKAFEGELTENVIITWTKLREVCENVEYGTSKKSEKNGLVPVLRMGNIRNGKLDWSDLKYTNDLVEIDKYHLQKNDVLFNRTNSPEHVGKTAIYKGEREAIFAGYLIRINYKKDEINGDYLNYFLNCHIAKQYGNKVKSFGVNQSNINGTKLKDYPFPKTGLNEQLKIVQEIETRLSVCDNVEANIKEALKKAELLRQSILKKAFEGELLTEPELEEVRNDPNWEPAEKLLERIQTEKASKQKRKRR